jgi:hypothetical protein
MAELKTKPNQQSVDAFLQSVTDDKKRADCYTILSLMQEISGAEAKMWGDAIVGFGSYHYKYASGREGDWFVTGFSPRKQNLTLYIMSGFTEYEALLQKLGKFTTGKACLYIKKIEDIDLATLRELIKRSVAHVAATNG